MATKEDLQSAIDSLNSTEPLFQIPKKDIIVKKLQSAYGDLLTSQELEDMADDLIHDGAGELVNKIDSEIAEVQQIISTVMAQVPALYSSMAGIAASLIQTTPAGPTVPNPIQINDQINQVKTSADTLASLFTQALSKIIELDASEYIPNSILAVTTTIAAIKDFPTI